MKGKLGGLGEDAQQHQDQGQRIEPVGTDQVTGSQYRSQLVAADDVTDQQNAGEQRQAATAGDRQRHARALARIRTMTPVADQQERRQARQLPEHQHQQEVFRKHHAQHGAHEEQEVPEEAAHRVFLRQVIARIKDDQQPDAENQQGEQEAQSVESQTEVQPQLGQPWQRLDFRFAREHLFALRQQQNQRRQRRQPGAECAGRSPGTLQQQRQEDPQEWQSDYQRKRHDLNPFKPTKRRHVFPGRPAFGPKP